MSSLEVESGGGELQGLSPLPAPSSGTCESRSPSSSSAPSTPLSQPVHSPHESPESSNSSQSSKSGGRLKFFKDGVLCLELSHLEDESQRTKWVQIRAKKTGPTIITTAKEGFVPTLPPPAFPPRIDSAHSASDDGCSNVTSPRNVEKLVKRWVPKKSVSSSLQFYMRPGPCIWKVRSLAGGRRTLRASARSLSHVPCVSSSSLTCRCDTHRPPLRPKKGKEVRLETLVGKLRAAEKPQSPPKRKVPRGEEEKVKKGRRGLERDWDDGRMGADTMSKAISYTISSLLGGGKGRSEQVDNSSLLASLGVEGEGKSFLRHLLDTSVPIPPKKKSPKRNVKPPISEKKRPPAPPQLFPSRNNPMLNGQRHSSTNSSSSSSSSNNNGPVGSLNGIHLNGGSPSLLNSNLLNGLSNPSLLTRGNLLSNPSLLNSGGLVNNGNLLNPNGSLLNSAAAAAAAGNLLNNGNLLNSRALLNSGNLLSSLNQNGLLNNSSLMNGGSLLNGGLGFLPPSLVPQMEAALMGFGGMGPPVLGGSIWPLLNPWLQMPFPHQQPQEHNRDVHYKVSKADKNKIEISRPSSEDGPLNLCKKPRPNC